MYIYICIYICIYIYQHIKLIISYQIKNDQYLWSRKYQDATWYDIRLMMYKPYLNSAIRLYASHLAYRSFLLAARHLLAGPIPSLDMSHPRLCPSPPAVKSDHESIKECRETSFGFQVYFKFPLVSICFIQRDLDLGRKFDQILARHDSMERLAT